MVLAGLRPPAQPFSHEKRKAPVQSGEAPLVHSSLQALTSSASKRGQPAPRLIPFATQSAAELQLGCGETESMAAKFKYDSIRAVADDRSGEVTLHSQPPLIMLIVRAMPACIPFGSPTENGPAETMAACGDIVPRGTHPSS